MRGAVSLTHDECEWIITLFLAATVVATPLTGWLAGKFGWRRFMVATLAGFTLSSAACGLEDSLEVLPLAQVAQGLLGAPLMPMGAKRLFSEEVRGLDGGPDAKERRSNKENTYGAHIS